MHHGNDPGAEDGWGAFRAPTNAAAPRSDAWLGFEGTPLPEDLFSTAIATEATADNPEPLHVHQADEGSPSKEAAPHASLAPESGLPAGAAAPARLADIKQPDDVTNDAWGQFTQCPTPDASVLAPHADVPGDDTSLGPASFAADTAARDVTFVLAPPRTHAPEGAKMASWIDGDSWGAFAAPALTPAPSAAPAATAPVGLALSTLAAGPLPADLFSEPSLAAAPPVEPSLSFPDPAAAQPGSTADPPPSEVAPVASITSHRIDVEEEPLSRLNRFHSSDEARNEEGVASDRRPTLEGGQQSAEPMSTCQASARLEEDDVADADDGSDEWEDFIDAEAHIGPLDDGALSVAQEFDSGAAHEPGGHTLSTSQSKDRSTAAAASVRAPGALPAELFCAAPAPEASEGTHATDADAIDAPVLETTVDASATTGSPSAVACMDEVVETATVSLPAQSVGEAAGPADSTACGEDDLWEAFASAMPDPLALGASDFTAPADGAVGGSADVTDSSRGATAEDAAESSMLAAAGPAGGSWDDFAGEPAVPAAEPVQQSVLALAGGPDALGDDWGDFLGDDAMPGAVQPGAAGVGDLSVTPPAAQTSDHQALPARSCGAQSEVQAPERQGADASGNHNDVVDASQGDVVPGPHGPPEASAAIRQLQALPGGLFSAEEAVQDPADVADVLQADYEGAAETSIPEIRPDDMLLSNSGDIGIVGQEQRGPSGSRGAQADGAAGAVSPGSGHGIDACCESGASEPLSCVGPADVRGPGDESAHSPQSSEHRAQEQVQLPRDVATSSPGSPGVSNGVVSQEPRTPGGSDGSWVDFAGADGPPVGASLRPRTTTDVAVHEHALPPPITGEWSECSVADDISIAPQAPLESASEASDWPEKGGSSSEAASPVHSPRAPGKRDADAAAVQPGSPFSGAAGPLELRAPSDDEQSPGQAMARAVSDAAAAVAAVSPSKAGVAEPGQQESSGVADTADARRMFARLLTLSMQRMSSAAEGETLPGAPAPRSVQQACVRQHLAEKCISVLGIAVSAAQAGFGEGMSAQEVIAQTPGSFWTTVTTLERLAKHMLRHCSTQAAPDALPRADASPEVAERLSDADAAGAVATPLLPGLRGEGLVLYMSSILTIRKAAAESRRLKQILDAFKLPYEEVDLAAVPHRRSRMLKAAGDMRDLPQLHCCGCFIGTASACFELHDFGELIPMLQDALRKGGLAGAGGDAGADGGTGGPLPLPPDVLRRLEDAVEREPLTMVLGHVHEDEEDAPVHGGVDSCDVCALTGLPCSGWRTDMLALSWRIDGSASEPDVMIDQRDQEGGARLPVIVAAANLWLTLVDEKHPGQ